MITAVWYAAGIIAALVLIQLFARQLEMLLRVLGNSIAGGAALWLLNLVGAQVGFHLALNPMTAVLTGLLGVPGVISLILMRRILG